MINRDALIRFRYRFIPDHVIGELLAKRWMDNAIPFLALIVVLIVFGRILPDFYSISISPISAGNSPRPAWSCSG